LQARQQDHGLEVNALAEKPDRGWKRTPPAALAAAAEAETPAKLLARGGQEPTTRLPQVVPPMERGTADRAPLSASGLSEPLIDDDKSKKHRPIGT
jgi:hypothetical protein